MRKIYSYVLLVLFQIGTLKAADDVTLTCYVAGCENQSALYLYEFNGLFFKPVITGEKKSDYTFEFKIPKSEPTFYYLGKNAKDVKPLILGSEEKVVLKAFCEEFINTKVMTSDMNKQYANLKLKMQDLNNEHGQLLMRYQYAANDEATYEKVNNDMQQLDEKKRFLLDSLKKANPFFSKVVGLNTYLSFQHNRGKHNDEIEYFGNQYFQFADWKDKAYNNLPWVYEGFKAYTETLTKSGIPAEKHKAFLDNAIKDIPKDSKAYQLALSGIVTVLNNHSHANFIEYANALTTSFEKTDPEAVAPIEQMIQRAQSFVIGGQAPDFVQNDVEGNPISLGDFRGKYVLLDFWASWCGPCRKENPNVVKMYQKYNEKGFEILGISLDNSKDRWLKAIAADGLTWAQVSDLKGWSNAVAKMYSVTSIPQTVLLNPEGKIIARNLRGPALEDKLAQLFQ